jgi:hypothetical protein
VITLLVVIFRVAFWLLVVRLSLRAAAALFGPRRPATSPPSTDAAVELVRDRVCNTFLPRGRAVRAVVGGREQLFCSAACAQRALAETTAH